jgi:hypothetical protein
MYDNHVQDKAQWLLDFLEQIRGQGFDWNGFFGSPQFPREPCYAECRSLATHGVNNGQAIKTGAVSYRLSGNPADIAGAIRGIEVLDQYHGQASGIFSCSEHIAGRMPSQGTELCTVVEAMFSFEVLFSVLGNTSHADRIEQLAYNALPAAIDPWM